MSTDNDAKNFLNELAIDTMARTLWGEARSEGERGMQAVANVIMTRVANPRWWGRDIVTVCQKPFQFSCWNESDPGRKHLVNVTRNDRHFRLALDIAKKAAQGTLPDIANGATHYYADYIPAPRWALPHKPCAIIGRHIFFRILEG